MSEVIIMSGGRVLGVLGRRMARRDQEVAILEELAEQQLIRSDYEGFRRASAKAWKMKVRNCRVMLAARRMQGGAA